MNVTMPPWGLGSLLAIIVIALCVVLLVIGRMHALEAGLFMALGIARLC